MVRPKKSESRNAQWTVITKAGGRILQEKLAEFLNTTAAHFHFVSGGEPRFVLCDLKISELPGFRGGVKPDHINRFGLPGQLRFVTAESLAGALGLDLGRLVEHVWVDWPGRSRARRTAINAAIIKRISDLSTENCEKFMRKPSEIYMSGNAYDIIAKLKEHGGVESLRAALHLTEVPMCKMSELETLFPNAFKNVIQPHIDSTRKFAKTWNLLLEPEFGIKFREIVEPIKRGADMICGWGAFLPCSLESYQYMVAHHRGLFKRLTAPNSEKINEYAEAYNQIGAANAKGTLAALEANKGFSLLHVMELRTVRQMARREGDFEFADDADMQSLYEHLAVLARQFKNRVRIAVVGDENQRLLEERHPGIESTWFIVQAQVPKAAIDRGIDGSIAITQSPKKAQTKLDRMMGTVLVRNPLDMNEFTDLLKRYE
jgi:hypothetical protein